MTYELVLDNSKLLANCFEESPLESFTLELPAWHSNLDGAGDSAAVSTPDTASFMSLSPGSRIGVGYFGESDTGAPVGGVNIHMPSTPAGYVLGSAKYVVIAKRSANDGAAFSPYTGYYPPPTTVPFLYCESSGVSDTSGNAGAPSEFVFNGISVGSYAEVECSAAEVLSRLSGGGIPATRLWNEDFIPGTGVGTATIDVAYFALRLYYEPA